jgi:hypothetical protein
MWSTGLDGASGELRLDVDANDARNRAGLAPAGCSAGRAQQLTVLPMPPRPMMPVGGHYNRSLRAMCGRWASVSAHRLRGSYLSSAVLHGLPSRWAAPLAPSLHHAAPSSNGGWAAMAGAAAGEP